MRKQFSFFITALALAALQPAAAQSWNITGNSNATTSSKLGTTTSIPLRLYTNNTQRVTITADGKMGVNTTTPPGLFTVQSNGSVPNAKWAPTSTQPVFFGFSENLNADFSLAAASNDPKQRPLFFGKRSRGTLASPSAVKTDDYLTSMAVYAYDGSAFQIPATIDFYADGTPSSGKVPSRISFVTGNNASDRKERLKVGYTGNFNFNDTQLYIHASDGLVGIGTTSPTAKLDVNGATNYIGANITGASFGMECGGLASGSYGIYGYGNERGVYGAAADGHYGIYGFSGYIGVYGTGPNYGTYGYTNDGAGAYGASYYDHGVEGSSTKSYGGYFTSTDGYGLYASSTNGYYAALFYGHVYSSDGFITSDKNLKKDIRDFGDAMSIISKLKPQNYEFKNDARYASLHLPKGRHYGLLAQDLEQVLPNLVSEAPHELRNEHEDVPVTSGADGKPVMSPSATKQKEKKDTISIKAVNYVELIPIMVKAMQEQQKSIEDQQKQIEQLKQLVEQLTTNNIKTSLSSVTLEQNNPNPLDNYTNIRYSLPAGSRSAQLVVTDMAGKKIKQIDLGSSPFGTVNFDASALASGSYTYSIIVDGKIADTKKMIVAKAVK